VIRNVPVLRRVATLPRRVGVLIALLGVLAVAAVVTTVVAAGGEDKKGGKAKLPPDPAPAARYFHTLAEANPNGGPTPLKVEFRVTPFKAFGKVRYEWHFDDGTRSTEQNPTHTFTKAGSYNAQVQATDSRGMNSTWNVVIGAWPPKIWAIGARQLAAQGKLRKALRDQARRTEKRRKKYPFRSFK
jgi:PKD domain